MVLNTGGTMSVAPLGISDPRSRVFRGEHENPVAGIAMHRESNRLVSVGRGGEVVFWDLKTGACFKKTCCPHVMNRSVAISPDGEYVAVASASHNVLLWGPEEHQMDVEPIGLVGHQSPVRFVAFSPHHGFLVSCGAEDRMLMVWNVKTHEQVTAIELPYHLRSIAFHPFQNSAVISLSDGVDSGRGFLATVVFDDSGEVLSISDPFCVHTWWIESVVFCSHGQSLVVGGSTGALKHISFPDFEILRTYNLPAHFSDAIALSSNGHILVVGGDKGLVYFYDVETGELLRELGTFRGNIESFSVSEDARFLAVNGCRFGTPVPADKLFTNDGRPFNTEELAHIAEHNRDGDLSPSILDFGAPNFGTGSGSLVFNAIPV